MSKLAHLCTTCHHQQGHHERIAGKEAYTGCECCRAAKFTPDPEPTLLATFTLATHKPEPLWKPGDTRNAGTGNREELCDCQACVAAYARETA